MKAKPHTKQKQHASVTRAASQPTIGLTPSPSEQVVQEQVVEKLAEATEDLHQMVARVVGEDPPKAPKPPTISQEVRRLVVRNPELTIAQLKQALIDQGWDGEKLQARMSTISTLRADAVAILAIAKQEGWTAPMGRAAGE